MVPVTGWSSSQPQITAPEAGSTAAATSPTPSFPGQLPALAAMVEASRSCTATRVVRTAGRIPLKRAMRKNSSRPRCTITPTARVNHHPPSRMKAAPNPPAAQPLARRAREVRLWGWGIKAGGMGNNGSAHRSAAMTNRGSAAASRAWVPRRCIRCTVA